MGKLIKFPFKEPSRFGYRKSSKRKKTNLEEHGQLNIFDQPKNEGRIVNFYRKSHFDLTLQLDEQNNLKAKEAYLNAIRNRAHIGDSYCNLGIIETREGNFTKAIDYFTRSLSYEPRLMEAHYNLGNIYSEMRNYDLAKLHYEIALQIDPGFSNIYYNLAIVLALINDLHGALNALSGFKRHSPPSEHGIADDLLSSLQNFLAHG
ncbi:MAG TPA: tetratricopeptide repeat protein [Cyclobacteriaceae bacterium]